MENVLKIKTKNDNWIALPSVRSALEILKENPLSKRIMMRVNVETKGMYVMNRV